MTSPYLTLVPRTKEAARAGERPQFVPSRLADFEALCFQRQQSRELQLLEWEKSPALESWTVWAKDFCGGVCVIIFMAAVFIIAGYGAGFAAKL